MADALVTGGCGFIGRHLVRALVERGERVRVLDLADPQGLPPEIEFVRGSVLDYARVREAMKDVSLVYHLAAVAHLWIPNRADFDRVNVQGTETVLRAALERRIIRLVHCSTEAILLPRRPPSDGMVDESSVPPEADMPGPYTRSKRRAELAALAAGGNGLQVVIVNPTVPIGCGDRNRTAPSLMLAHFLNGGSPFFLDCVLNLVAVEAVAEGLILAGARGAPGQRYILGGENVPMRRLLKIVERASGRKMPNRAISPLIARAAAAIAEWAADFVTGRRPVVTKEGVRLAMRSLPFDCRKARQELGYPLRPIEPALVEMVWSMIRSEPAR